MAKSDKELAIELLAAYINGKASQEGISNPSSNDLVDLYNEFLQAVKKMRD